MPSILIIEDDLLLLEALGRLLKKGGYEVDTAVNGNEGMQKVKANRYDMVITDLIMPYTEGFEIVRHIRMYQKNEHVRIVVYTSLGNEVSEEAGYKLGIDAYIVKPVPAARFLEQIGALLPGPEAEQL